MLDFRRPGRRLVFSPDFPNHALVGLRSGLKQCKSPAEPDGKRALCICSTSPRRPPPTQRLAPRAAFF